jgi:MFS transporter, DHA1 family, multidrug resistance protein
VGRNSSLHSRFVFLLSLCILDSQSTLQVLSLTLFVAGYGIGPMIWAPMSEIPQFGRNPVYIGTLVVFIFLQFSVIYAKNFGMLLAFRFLTGFFGSPVLATGGASLGDMYAPSKRAYALAIWGKAAVVSPALGPLVGGFAIEAKGWTWAIWELMWFSGFALVTSSGPSPSSLPSQSASASTSTLL